MKNINEIVGMILVAICFCFVTFYIYSCESKKSDERVKCIMELKNSDLCKNIY